MLLFIGGAARTGKGILVRRLLSEMQIPYLSLDVLKMGLARGVPEFGIDPDAGPIIVAEKLWPLVREMSPNLLEERVDFAIEGEVLPKHVDALRRAYPSQVTGCFLGYTAITPAQKLHEIRTYGGHPNDWPSEYSDPELLRVITMMIEFSGYLKIECTRYDFRYFDMSQDFAQMLEQIMAHIRGLRFAERHGL
jgi:hypothetical protein